MARRTSDFQTIRSEGGLLPPDLLRRLIDPKGGLPGTKPEDYGLAKSERINESVTQSWNRLNRHWADFRAAAKGMPESDALTGLTNDKWSLPLLRELGFGFLPTTHSPTIDGKTYAINRFAGPTPIHLVGCGVSLDRRAAGVRGAAAINPHGLVQELLNRSPDHLWAIVSNGLRFRVLRDNQALSRQSYLEFDLETMFDGEIFADFVLLWLVVHASRFLAREANRPESCYLEAWAKEAETQGTRALTQLRSGVEKALEILGQGFVSHPKNTALRDALRSGQFRLTDFHGQLLRVVYRLIFLFVAEDRQLDGLPLLHPRDTSDAGRLARERYSYHYSAHRLRELATRIKGSRHGDLWRQFNLIVGAVSGDERFAAVRQSLALPALGSTLWSPISTDTLNAPGLATDGGTELANYDFLEALRLLGFTRQGKVLRPVDYKNLGSEEFGGVYESFLALTPQISSDGARFTFAEFAGNERKTSGSYYTPDSLVQCLLDSALDPVVQERLAGKTGKEAEKALLAIKVCDKAVGSGHFLVGAAHRLARHLARVRALAAGESEPSPLLYQTALRDVIGHCLYGVDINPMAVELCKVTLWLEALEPGKPLSFLDHHIRCGNSLLGATRELIAKGIPDGAFEAIEGDDKKVCSALRKRNKQEREGQADMFHSMVAEPSAEYDSMDARRRGIDEAPDDTLAEVVRKSEQFQRLIVSPEYEHARDVADAWCAAFVWRKEANASCEPITTDTIIRLQEDREALAPAQAAEVKRLADQYQFFHFHLAFPEVSAQGGFDVSLGNPPWEKVKLQDKEWFAERRADIAEAPNAGARKRLIERLAQDDPALHAAFVNAVRQADGESHVLRDSGLYPLCARGDLNLYAVFAEAMRNSLANTGRMGTVLPSGIATDDTTKFYFQDVVNSRSLASFFDFENKGIFTGVHDSYKFCLFTAGSGKSPLKDAAEFVFYAHSIDDLSDPERRFTLSSDDIALVNPNSRTCPIFRVRADAELAKFVFRKVPVLLLEGREDGNPWGIKFTTMFHMTNDGPLFRTRDTLLSEGFQLDGNRFGGPGETWFPVLEGKMVAAYDHRAANIELRAENAQRQQQSEPASLTQRQDATFANQPYLWAAESEGRQRTPDSWNHEWFLAFKRVTAATNERTLVGCFIPWTTASYTLYLVTCAPEHQAALPCLGANLFSFIGDFFVRQKTSQPSLPMGVIYEAAFLPPGTYAAPCGWSSAQTLKDWLLPRVLELTYTAWDLEAFAQDCGWSGPPFRWDEERRFLLRCELDAAFFHLYLGLETEWRQQPAALTQTFPTPRAAVSYILDTFPIVKRKDEAKFNGDYRTKRTILEIYDALAESMQTGKTYQTRLKPAPATIWIAHPPQFDRERVNMTEPGDYILAFVGSLLRHLDGECDLMKLARAYALLLPSRSTYAALAEAQFGAEAQGWMERFNQSVDAKWFLPILRAMDNRNIVVLEEHGDDVTVRLKDAKGPPTSATIEADVFLVLRILDLVPEQQLVEPTKRLVPKAPRISMREAKLVPA